MSPGRAIDLLRSAGASAARAGLGGRVAALGARPARPLLLWEFEGCPFCRKVREAISILDLEVVVHPCPKRGERFRPEAVARGGKTQFPLLVDPNEGDRALYESDAIVAHLFARYGRGAPPLALRLGPLTTATSALASAARMARGASARPSRAPSAPLALWASEGSVGSRLVREVLCELELPYHLTPVARGSAHRDALLARHGTKRIPVLEDPAAGFVASGVEPIVAHLERTYALRSA